MNTRILREVPEKRERNVKHFQMKEKGTAAAVYAVPVHYEENGNWQEIDNRLESAVQGGFIRTKHPEFMYVLRSRQEMKS